MKAAEIRSLRTRLKMTQQDFASLLGFSVVSVNKWEGGETKPTDQTAAILELLKNALGAHPAEDVEARLRVAGGRPIDVMRTLVEMEAKHGQGQRKSLHQAPGAGRREFWHRVRRPEEDRRRGVRRQVPSSGLGSSGEAEVPG